MKSELLDWYAKHFIDQFYEVKVPLRLNMTELALDRWANRIDGDKLTAIYYEDKAISFRELQRMVNRIGNLLRREGVGLGDRILVRMGNHPMYLALNLAIIKIGAVAVPTSTLFMERELEYILSNCKANFAVVAPDIIGPIEAVKAKVLSLKKILTVTGKAEGYLCIDELMSREKLDLTAHSSLKTDLAFVLYTSGTTGFPKGVPHNHAWILAVGDPNMKFVMHLGPGDIMLTPSEMTWMWPWAYCFWWTLCSGGATGIYSGRFDPERTWSYVSKYRVTHTLGNPTIYRRMLKVTDLDRYDKSSMKMSFSSGETVEPSLFEEWKRKTGAELYDCLGQTESHVFVCTRRGVLKPGSLGKPLPGCPVAVVREDGSLCGVDEVGHLAIDRDWEGLTRGYINLEEEWAKRFKNSWYLTWDFAKIDAEGYFWYVARTDDLIKSRGYLISPKEIEDTLAEHPAVSESAVIPVKDEDLGERIKAFIVLNKDFKSSEELSKEIKAFIRSRIAPYKVPKEIQFIESLPRTVTGKTMRKVLKEREASGS